MEPTFLGPLLLQLRQEPIGLIHAYTHQANHHVIVGVVLVYHT